MFPFRSKKNQTAYEWYFCGPYWEQGRQILDEAHILIAGSTGCGKSTLIHKLMWTALASTPAQTQFILVDMKMGMEMGQYARLPHTIKFAMTADEALSALDYAIAIMEDRCRQMYSVGQKIWQGSDIYVVVDELANLFQECGRKALDRLTKIGRLGRAARVHLLLATQSPQRGDLGIPAALAQNMTCRIGMRCLTAIESRQIIGMAGCEALPRYGTAYITLGPDLYTLPINPMSEEVYAERIRYWMTPELCMRKKGA